MKEVSSLNTSDNSPKTPGGISKSLLTPCRRIGLSRTWRKSGPSPFISPVSIISNDIKEENLDTRKRKGRYCEEKVEGSNNENITQIFKHSNRNDEDPCRKRFKNLLPANCNDDTVLPKLVGNEETVGEQKNSNMSKDVEKLYDTKEPKKSLTLSDKSVNEIARDFNVCNNDITPIKTLEKQSTFIQDDSLKQTKTSQRYLIGDTLKTDNSHGNFELISKPVKTKSKNKNSISLKKNQIESKLNLDNKVNECEKNCNNNEKNELYTNPNELKKECIVVLQKKIFKNVENCTIEDKTCNSDDDEPLINFKKQHSSKPNLSKENDVIEQEHHNHNHLTNKSMEAKGNKKGQLPTSQNIVDDEDDDFDDKKTILIRKSYKKVSAPMKCKSTGSITQRDIDNLKNKIEAKKKLLLAQASSPDTEELRTLIKKWQKGCQDALMELLDLMKNKLPDTENMNYSEMLGILKIPPSLVGYDSANDCFNSPDDVSIILGKIKDV